MLDLSSRLGGGSRIFSGKFGKKNNKYELIQ